jgi:hypothetical protein
MDNIPTRNNNPGDLRNTTTGAFNSYSTPQEGFDALNNDLQTKISGKSKTGITPDSSLLDFSKIYAPASDNNDPVSYANNLAKKLGVTSDTPISSLSGRVHDFASAIADNEGYQGNRVAGSSQTTPQVQPIADNTPALAQTYTKQQLTENINAMEDQGASQSEIQDYLDGLGKGTKTPTPPPTIGQQIAGAPAEQPDNSVIGKIGNVTDKVTGLLGMNPLLKGLGQTAANVTGMSGQEDVAKAQEQGMDIQTQLLERIKQNQAAGKDTTRLQSALQQLSGSLTQESQESTDLGTAGITNKQVIGSAIDTAAMFAPGAGKGASLLTKVLVGGATGYTLDVGTNLQNSNKTIGQDFTPGLGTAVGAVLPFAGYLISALTKKFVGFTAGTGEAVIQRAIDNPDAVGEAVTKYAKSPEAKQELVNTATTAVQDFVKQKGQEFGNAINSMTVKEGGFISKTPAENAFKDALDTFGVGINQTTEKPTGTLDFTNSSLSKEAESSLNQVFDKINNWKDETPKGLDSLRQYIKGEMGNYKIQGASKVDAVLNSTMKALRSNLSENLNGYASTLQNFSEKSQTTTELLKELGLSGVAKPSTKLANVMKVFKKDPSVMDNLYKVMGPKEANDFLNQISGAVLSDWIPSGKVGNAMRTAGDVGLGIGAHALGIGAAPAVGAAVTGAAVASPRIVGALARTAGSRVGQVASKTLQKGITAGVSKLNP